MLLLHNPWIISSASFCSTHCSFIQYVLYQFVNKNAVSSNVKSLNHAKVKHIQPSPMFTKSMFSLQDVIRFFRNTFPFVCSNPSSPSCPSVFLNCFRDYLLHHLLVSPWAFILVLPEDISGISIFKSLEIYPNLYSVSERILSNLTMSLNNILGTCRYFSLGLMDLIKS